MAGVPCRSVLPPGSMPLTFTVKGIEPADHPAWNKPQEQIRFWTVAGAIAMEVKQRELQAGLDHAGRPLKPVKPRRLRYKSGKRLDGKPLMPHRALSRTRRLLRYIVQATQIVFYWEAGWSKILDYHRRGAVLKRGGRCVGRLPVRNVFGISPAGKREIQTRAREQWEKRIVAERPIDPIMTRRGLGIELPQDVKAMSELTQREKQQRLLSMGVQSVINTSNGQQVRNIGTNVPGARRTGILIRTSFK